MGGPLSLGTPAYRHPLSPSTVAPKWQKKQQHQQQRHLQPPQASPQTRLRTSRRLSVSSTELVTTRWLTSCALWDRTPPTSVWSRFWENQALRTWPTRGLASTLSCPCWQQLTPSPREPSMTTLRVCAPSTRRATAQ